MWPQIIYLAWTFIGLGSLLAKHGAGGRPSSFVMVLVVNAVPIALLYWGGFFAPLGWH